MKTSIAKTAIIAAIALIITTGSSCKKEDMRLNAQNTSQETSPLSNRPLPPMDPVPNILTGKMVVYLKTIGDAGLGAINLTFTGIALHYQDERIGTKGWVIVETKPTTQNILKYQTGQGLILAASKTLPLGDIDQTRVIFGNPNYVVWGNSSGRYKADLLLDKGAARVSTPLKARVQMQKTMLVTLDINANMSIDHEVIDQFILKPAIFQEGIRFGDVNPD